MTKREALESHIELWDWLADNPLMCKSEWPGFDLLEHNIRHECFACEYNKQNNNKFCNERCIIPEFSMFGNCQHDHSAFSRWEVAIWENNPNESPKYAKIIADSGREALKALDAK